MKKVWLADLFKPNSLVFLEITGNEYYLSPPLSSFLFISLSTEYNPAAFLNSPFLFLT